MVPKELLAFGTTVKKKESALYGETALAGLQVCEKEPLLTALHLLTNRLSICSHRADGVASYMHSFSYCSVLWHLRRIAANMSPPQLQKLANTFWQLDK